MFLFLPFSLLLQSLAPTLLGLVLLAGCIVPLFSLGSQIFLIPCHLLLLFCALFLVDSHSFTSFVLIPFSLDRSRCVLIGVVSQKKPNLAFRSTVSKDSS